MNIAQKTFLAFAAGALTLAGATAGHASDLGESYGHPSPTDSVQLPLGTSNAAIAACFPKASASVDVAQTTDAIGKDTFRIKAHGLKPKISFTVFLLEQAKAPFGAAEYVGDFTTNKRGNASNTYKLIVEEAFAFDIVTGVRKDLQSVGVWFADPADDDECLGGRRSGHPVRRGAQAGVQMLNSGDQLLP